MPATTKTPLGASTTNRKWYVDVDANDGVGTASWLPVLGITALTPNFDDANLEDDSDYDSGGYGSQTKTGAAWSVQLTVGRKGTTADVTAYDPGQEHLRARAIGKFGASNSVTIRVYEMEPGGPRVEAYTGKAAVTFQEQGGGETALSTAQVTLTGQGALAVISHPDTGAAVPSIASLDDSAIPTAGGDLVLIRGTRFTGTTAVTFGGTAASDFTVVSDGLIAAVAPAHAAGTVAVVVTNGAGASTVNPNVVYS